VASSFSIEPYQLGKGNDEGIETGAWWFYYKLGFRPRAAAALRIARTELARIEGKPAPTARRPPRCASSPTGTCFSTLTPRTRASFRGSRTSASASPRNSPGLRRRIAPAHSTRRATRLMRPHRLRSLRGFTAGERLAWRRWSRSCWRCRVARWSTADLRAVARVGAVQGPAGDERDFAALFRRAPAAGTGIVLAAADAQPNADNRSAVIA